MRGERLGAASRHSESQCATRSRMCTSTRFGRAIRASRVIAFLGGVAYAFAVGGTLHPTSDDCSQCCMCRCCNLQSAELRNPRKTTEVVSSWRHFLGAVACSPSARVIHPARLGVWRVHAQFTGSRFTCAGSSAEGGSPCRANRSERTARRACSTRARSLSGQSKAPQ